MEEVNVANNVGTSETQTTVSGLDKPNDTPNSAQATEKSVEATASQAGNGEKTFRQADVDEIVKERLAQKEKSDLDKILKRLGITDDKDIEGLAKKAQLYDVSAKALEEKSKLEKSESEALALMKSGIDPNRYDDVRFHFKGKGAELTEEAVKAELESHPEWKVKSVEPSKQTTISALGSVAKPTPAPDERKQVLDLIR